MADGTTTINNVAPLRNVSALSALIERVAGRDYGLPGMACFYGPSGYGKSIAATWCANRFDARLVQVKSSWTSRKLCEAILLEMGVKPRGSIADMIDAISERLADKKIIQIIGASLTNRPNLVGITALNTENAGMSWDKIAKALGLADGAGEEDILAAIGKMTTATAAQSALAEVGTALGVADGDSAAIVAAAKAAKAGDTAMTALQAELNKVAADLVALQTETKREKATAFVDAAIARGCVGVKPRRDHYIARHMADPEGVEADVNAMQVLAPGTLPAPAKVAADGAILSLNAEQAKVAAALGISQADYLKTLNAEKGVLA